MIVTEIEYVRLGIVTVKCSNELKDNCENEKITMHKIEKSMH